VDDAEIVVVGAGLAGLRAAWRLAEAGREVLVLEAGDEVGGRERTRVVDGFRLDRGFHVLNPVYPAVRRWVDLDALELQYFGAGVEVRREHGRVTLAHPLRHPGLLPATLRSGLLRPRELAGLAAWAGPVLADPRRVKNGPDDTLAARWDALGVRGPLRTEALEPFLAGVLAEDAGRTSDAFVRLLVRTFALGRPAVPAQGIGALPRQLARRATAAGARLGTGARVEDVTRSGARSTVRLADGGRVTAAAVLVAVGAEAAPALTGVEAAPTKGLTTWWFDAPGAPDSRFVAVDGRRSGPVLDTAVMSAVAPGYAPAGRTLVQATALLDASRPVTDAEALRQTADIWGVDPAPWRLIARDDLPHALPEQPAPLSLRRPVRVGEGLYCCGDHRDTASIQGALVSGERAAAAVLADLGHRPAGRAVD